MMLAMNIFMPYYLSRRIKLKNENFEFERIFEIENKIKLPQYTLEEISNRP